MAPRRSPALFLSLRFLYHTRMGLGILVNSTSLATQIHNLDPVGPEAATRVVEAEAALWCPHDDVAVYSVLVAEHTIFGVAIQLMLKHDSVWGLEAFAPPTF